MRAPTLPLLHRARDVRRLESLLPLDPITLMPWERLDGAHWARLPLASAPTSGGCQT